jgi:hypothetical protein
VFIDGFDKAAGVLDTVKNIGAAAWKTAKSPAGIAMAKKNATRGAIGGAVAGGISGAVSKDENGHRGGFGGALKGAVGGAALGGAAGGASSFADRAFNRGKAAIRGSSWNKTPDPIQVPK